MLERTADPRGRNPQFGCVHAPGSDDWVRGGGTRRGAGSRALPEKRSKARCARELIAWLRVWDVRRRADSGFEVGLRYRVEW